MGTIVRIVQVGDIARQLYLDCLHGIALPDSPTGVRRPALPPDIGNMGRDLDIAIRDDILHSHTKGLELLVLSYGTASRSTRYSCRP